MILYFVRHGDPEYTHDTLTPSGIKQAKYVAKYFKDIPIDKIFCSPRGRAKLTASFTSDLKKIKPVILPWTDEQLAANDLWDHKANTWYFFSNKWIKIFHEIENNPKWYLDKRIKGTKIKQGVDRINKCLEEWLKSINIIYDKRSKMYKSIGKVPERIILFAHGGMSYPFMANLLKINFPLYAYRFTEHSTCGITRIQINVDHPHNIRVLAHNEVVYPINLDKKTAVER